jgi:uncharacterized protein with HEPN domain
MSPEISKRDAALLLDIREACLSIIEFTLNVSYDDYLLNKEKQSAIIHQIIIMGQAVRDFSEEFLESHSEIPWFQISGMRNRLVHDYRNILLRQVWVSATDDVPKLLDFIAPLCKDLE